MPTIEIKKPLAEIKKMQVIIECDFPPSTNSEGAARYGEIKHIEFKGNDVDGNQAGNVYFANDELSDTLKAKLVTVMLQEITGLASEVNATVDLTPTPFVPPVVEEVVDGEGEG